MLPDFELSCTLFGKYGLTLNREKYEKLQTYSDLLVEWNQKINLTAIVEPEQILIKHFLDSAILLTKCEIPCESTIIDVGTGAGFPAIPLKIMLPDLKITLLDSLSKRITFLENVCNNLNISANFIHGRAEDYARLPEYREKFDISCARAVASLPVLSEYCLPFVKIDGSFIAMKGPNEAVEQSSDAIRILGGIFEKCVDYSVEEEQRRIIVIKKISQTPTKYPRNSAQIKKKPL